MTTTIPELNRAALAAAGETLLTPPERIVHIGLGAFHRAHQAWYTARADDASQWGITAFTGRSPVLAQQLQAQDGLYTLVERGADGDRFQRIGSIIAAHPAEHTAQLTAALSAPATALVTLTVTEAGYSLTATNEPDLSDPDLRADLHALAGGSARGSIAARTVLGRMLVGLDARRLAGAGPISIVPCDNFPDNGATVARALTILADDVSADLGRWVRDSVAFVSTSVDRITPRLDVATIGEVAEATGWHDAAPVVTEPFSDWILSGTFPAGRPQWETAGARFVTDIGAFESRKLWLLNGAHSLLAYLGRLRGHATVAEAITDPVCRVQVEQWWDEASRHLPAAVDTGGYRVALVDRFRNPRIAHSLAQISGDAVAKLSIRIAPVVRAELAAGRGAPGGAAAVGAWISTVTSGMTLQDAHADEVGTARGTADPVAALLALVAPDLAAHPSFLDDVRIAARSLSEHD